MQSESSSVLFEQIPNRRVVGTDQNAICRYFASIKLYLALLFILSILFSVWIINPFGDSEVWGFSLFLNIKDISSKPIFDLLQTLAVCNSAVKQCQGKYLGVWLLVAL